MRAIRIHRHGDPDVLRLDEVPVPQPGPGEIRVRLDAIGVNFIDIYHRTGFYPLHAEPPVGLGKEGVGTVTAVGESVEELDSANLTVGDRVAFWDAREAYAEEAVIPAARAIPLDDFDALDPVVVAAGLLQGMTAHYLTRTIAPLRAGDTVLIHAVAGGVGLLATQMAKQAGATVLGTCSTAQKAQRARDAGADHVILYREEDFVAAARRLTDGRGVDVTLDGVGKSTFLGSVEATRVRGHIVLFGQASGAPDPIDPREVLGSRTLTTASLVDYSRERAELLERSRDVLRGLADGSLVAHVDRELPLAEAAAAHRLLEGRATTGKLVLRPG